MRRLLCVLVVEDEPSVSELFVLMLGRTDRNLTVEFARDLKSALARLDAGGVDAVTLDLNMPDAQGVEAVAAVVRKHPEVVVAVISAMGDERHEEAMRAGADCFFAKPVESWRLVVDAIRQAVIRREVRREAGRDHAAAERSMAGTTAVLDEYRRGLEGGT